MWQELFAAICLVLVIEGMMPFLSPATWRKQLLLIAQLNDKQIRTIGLLSMLAGAGLLYVVKSWPN